MISAFSSDTFPPRHTLLFFQNGSWDPQQNLLTQTSLVFTYVVIPIWNSLLPLFWKRLAYNSRPVSNATSSAEPSCVPHSYSFFSCFKKALPIWVLSPSSWSFTMACLLASFPKVLLVGCRIWGRCKRCILRYFCCCCLLVFNKDTES